MGLFSFIKNAGAAIGIGKSTAEEAAEKAEAIKAANEAAASKMVQTASDLGLEVQNMQVIINDDTAIVSGLAADQSTKEKVILVVGNTSGIAQVDDQMEIEEAEVQEPEATFHTVVSGDTLSKIAKKVYGDAMKYPVIFEANKPMLTHPDKIYPGQVLRIPVLSA
ncbi:peptidoglycan-binding protein LysM [Aquimarina agarivorans]|uniref:peptidoglycan-binding protein LysM n=1 Tax=Aquimarina agarivorans TaxID=980584 RepID=UPI000248EB60|nr:peptidoglycan-binding protein LysM [Aquimarina agarivorans]